MAHGGPTIHIMPAEFKATHAANYSNAMLEAMYEKYEEKSYTDLVIKVKDVSIPCHRIVVYSASPALEMDKDKKAQNTREILLGDLNPEIVSNIVRFLYGQEVVFSWNSVKDVLEANRTFQLMNLDDQISQLVSQHVIVDNVVSMWQLSQKYKLDEVRFKAITLMATTMGTVGGSVEFKKLKIKELLTIIKDDDLRMESRDDLLLACVEWVDYAPVDRKDNMIDIVKNIKLFKCSINAQKIMKKKYQELVHDVDVLSLILDDVLDRELLEAGAIEKAVSAREKRTLILLGGLVDNSVNTKVLVSHQIDNGFDWEEHLALPESALAHYSPIVTLDDGFILLCGGEDKKRTTRYDAQKKVWRDLPPIPEPLSCASAVVCSNGVYLLGNHPPSASVWRLDLASLAWQKQSDMREKQRWPIATSIGTTIWVVANDVGSADKKQPITLQEYKVIRSWVYKSRLPTDTPRTRGAVLVAAMEDSLYLVGGQQKVAAHYHIPSDAWTLLNPPPDVHTYGGAVFHAGKIMLVGGHGSQKDASFYSIHPDDSQQNASVYNIDTGEWSIMPSNLPIDMCAWVKVALVSWV